MVSQATDTGLEEDKRTEKQMADIENSIYIIGITHMLRPCT